MLPISSDLLRIDSLTGCRNYLGFLESITSHSLPGLTKDGRSRELLRSSGIDLSLFSAILFLDMNNVREFNETHGRGYGDSVIRWMGILLREESKSEVYRIGGVEFAVLLKLDSHEEHLELMRRVMDRVEREAGLLGFTGPAADVALIFFDKTPASLDGMLMIMGEAMVTVKNSGDKHFMTFNITDFKIHSQATERWKAQGESDLSFAVRWISQINIHQVLELGKALDETQQEAFTDAISGLPNMKAAIHRLEAVLQESKLGHRPFAILMIDGDNIRVYNSINYAAGDEMIRSMSAVFRANLRPNDFVARWRSGDEFLIILPDTGVEGACKIGDRFRLAVKAASQAWRYPVTISVGAAGYPVHGETIKALIDNAETANKLAKELGKDRVEVTK